MAVVDFFGGSSEVKPANLLQSEINRTGQSNWRPLQEQGKVFCISTQNGSQHLLLMVCTDGGTKPGQ